MVKKLRCDVVPTDWVRIVKYGEDIAVQVRVGGENTDIFLTTSDAKKLRKQIKAALAEIEDEPEEDIAEEKEEPAYIPHVGEVVEVYRNTNGHEFDIGERVRIVKLEDDGTIRAEYLDDSDYWWVENNIRPIQNWKPKEGEKVLIVDSTFVPGPETRSWVGKFGYVGWSGVRVCKIYNEDKSDWFSFHASDLRPAE